MRAYWMLVAVIVGAACSSAFGQIQVPEHTPLGEPIIAAVQLPEGGKVAWKPANGFRFIESDGKVYIWAKPGRYEIEGALIALKDGQVDEFQFLKASFSVGDAPTPDPAPAPRTLRELVTAEQAAKLAKLHADFARLVRESPSLHTDSFRKLYAEQVTALGLLEHGAKSEVGKRILAVIGSDAKALDEPTRKALADALAAIAAEFGGAPAPAEPTVPADPDSVAFAHDGFYVIVVDESGDRPAWVYELTASADVQAYLNSHCAGGRKGWRHWDKDETATNAPAPLKDLMAVPRQKVPCVVIAANKRAVVKDLPKEPAALLELLKAYGGA